jgi:hypothetical protein
MVFRHVVEILDADGRSQVQRSHCVPKEEWSALAVPIETNWVDKRWETLVLVFTCANNGSWFVCEGSNGNLKGRTWKAKQNAPVLTPPSLPQKPHQMKSNLYCLSRSSPSACRPCPVWCLQNWRWRGYISPPSLGGISPSWSSCSSSPYQVLALRPHLSIVAMWMEEDKNGLDTALTCSFWLRSDWWVKWGSFTSAKHKKIFQVFTGFH